MRAARQACLLGIAPNSLIQFTSSSSKRLASLLVSAMALLASTSALVPLSLFHHSPRIRTRFFPTRAAISSSSPDSSESIVSSASPLKPFPQSFDHTLSNRKGSPLVRLVRSAESTIERVIFDFRFLALLAIGGSLAGSLLCFLNGCVYIVEAYKVYWTSCVKGIHTGNMVLRLVEAIDVYLAGTVMLIFGMGLYGLFISNVPPDVPANVDRALKGSSLFGMFALKERPQWMKISSLDELKTKVGHVIVMILLVKMFERSKMVRIATGLDLLSYSVCIFLSSASLYILHNLHKSE
ncbi:uncharacterized protein LOC131163899 [Malania oleifera]|uniref:uncharacterized protein LOC131163899 n=1 Tax=Malania oleifera TaxID=397392 RepID=UPI0025ADD862|nr:uncharacterized protein LOC131163899 [Malania oleifera]